MIDIKRKEECCGCNACGDACPKGCITFKEDIEGFSYPVVDKETCIDCHLCEKACPIINVEKLKKNDLEEPECHAAVSKNIMTRFASTSGGMFSVLALQMYKQGGYVGGAIFDEGWMVSQLISNNKSDLEKIRGSKLHQSNSQGFYEKVRDLLKAGEKVLVCGIPCQMAALRSFLKKDYENLIIVDLICRGINSPKVFSKWLSFLEDEYGAKVQHFRVKSKELGWRKLTTKVVFENGKVLYDTNDTNFFTIGYLSTGVYCRPSCYECKFKGFPRIADITIGDFWGAGNTIGEEMDGDIGTSVVLLNNEKGKKYYQSIASKLKEKKVPFDVVVKGNPALISPLLPPKVNREDFYKDLDKSNFKDIAAKYIHRDIDQKPSKKRQIKNLAKFILSVMGVAGISIPTYWKNIKYNLFSKKVHTNILHAQYMLVAKHTILDFAKNANISVGGVVTLGAKRIKGSKLETRILVEDGASLDFKGNATIMYGADIEAFKNSKIIFGKTFLANINFTCISAEKIEIEDNVSFGRECVVRDNNGGHYISRRGFKNAHPVTIGQHCWICENSILMPGAKLGTGVIVGARSFVRSSFPSFTMVMGHPAEVVDEDIYFKM